MELAPSWFPYAWLSAAALTPVLAKVGVDGAPSTLTIAIRTLVVVVFAWAPQLGPASRVAPIDELTLPLRITPAAPILHETITWRVAAGALLMTVGALLMI